MDVRGPRCSNLLTLLRWTLLLAPVGVAQGQSVSITQSGGSTAVSETGPTSDSYTIVLTTQPTASVQVTADPDTQTDLGAGAGVPVLVTFTTSNWSTPQTITVTAVDDAIVEGSHNSTITHSANSADPNYNGISIPHIVATVTDNDSFGVTITQTGGSTDVNETGSTADSYTIVLTSQPTASVTITVDPDIDTDIGSGPGVPENIVISPASWNIPRTVIVSAVDDTDVEGPHTSTITHTATSADPNYNGITISNVVVNVTDNDAPGVTVRHTGGSTAVNEQGPTSDSYAISLDKAPTADVVITVDPDNQTDVGAGPGVAITVTFQLATWDVARNVTVTAVDDLVQEGNHTSTITHSASSADPNYNGISIANIVASVTDNDTAGVLVTESGGSTAVSETGPTSDTYTIVLTSQPSASVTITLTPDAQTSLGSGGGTAITRTFTTSNWNTPQTITVTAINDNYAEGPHTSTITHAASSSDPNYNGISISNVVASVTDNDTASVAITQSGDSTNVSEAGPTSDSYTLVLTSQPTASVTITIDPDSETDLGSGAGVAITKTFTTSNWATAQTITVTAVNDHYVEGNHTSTITHSASSGDSNYNNITINNVVANITDNDTAGVTVTQSGGSTAVDETGPTSDSYTLVLTSRPRSNVTVTVQPDAQVDLGAGAGTQISFVFTDGNWNTPRTVVVTAVDDAVQEGPHTSTITHAASSADPDYNGLTILDVVVSVTDNDRPGVTLTQSGGSTAVSETGPTSDAYTVVLDSPPSGNVMITVDPDAQTDLGSGAGVAIVLTFTAADWNVAQLVTVTAVNDAVAEGAHTSTITHTAVSSDANYNGITIPNITVNITDNDTAGVTITQSGGSTAVAEQGPTSDTYTLVLTSQPTADVTITVAPDTQTTVGAGAGIAITRTFTSANWNTPQTVTVTAIDDAVQEGTHTSTITHVAASADSNYMGITIADVVVTITDNDTPGVVITQTGGSTDVDESGPTSDTYTLVLASQPGSAVHLTVDPDTQTDVGAGAGASIQLTFNSGNWNTPQTVTVTAVDDAIAEGAHTSTITHTVSSSDGNYNGLSVASVVANVTDNDAAGVTITQSGGSTAVSETGPTSDTYTLVLTSQPTANVTITVDPDTQTDLGAGAGAAITKTFTTANWSTPQTVTVTAVNDAVAEGTHTSTITHTATSSDNNYNGISIANVSASITDNDTAGVTITESGGSTNVSEAGPTSDTYTLVLTSQPTADVTITVDPDTQTNLGSGAGAPITRTFTSSNWNTPQTITVTAVNDSVAEGTHTSTITHTVSSSDPFYNNMSVPNVVATITDNDTAGVTITQSGGSTNVSEAGPTSDTYTLRLTSQPTANVTITIDPDTQTNLGSGAGAPITKTFTSSNWNTPQTITVTAVNDSVAEGTHTSTITHTVSSSDPFYNNMSVPNVVATITDNDTAGVTITQSGGSTDVSEAGPTSDSYTLVLTSQPTADVTITVDPDTQTDLGAGQGVAITRTFTSANWNTTQTVTVTAVNDSVAEGTHTSTITHTVSSSDPFYNNMSVPNVVATITDNDTAGVTITQSGGSTDVSEAGPTSDSYTLVLTSQPTADVTITVDPDTQTDLGAGQGVAITRTFTSANWNTTQTVTVTAVDDDASEGNHTSTITHTVSSGDTFYNGLSVSNITVNVTDNDIPGVTIAETGGSTAVDENGPTSDTYTLVLNTRPTASVTITVDPDAQTDLGSGAGTAVTLTFTTGNWNTPQTITVTAVDDPIIEGTHSSVITHTAASSDPNYHGLSISSVTASVADNDHAEVVITPFGGSLSVNEEGPTSGTYTIELTSRPSATVTILADPDVQTDAGAGAGSAILVTILPADWNVPQTVTVTAVDDAVVEGNHSSLIQHASISSDSNYHGLTIQSLLAAVADNDVSSGGGGGGGGGGGDTLRLPTAEDQNLEMLEDDSLSITLTASGEAGRNPAFYVVSGPLHGALTGQPPRLTYRPEADFFGEDGFIFIVVNDEGGSDEGEVAITVIPVNDVPTGVNQTVVVPHNTPTRVLLDIYDADGDEPILVTIIQPPVHGTLSGQPPELIYTPDTSYAGTDRFGYRLDDGQTVGRTIYVTLDVLESDDEEPPPPPPPPPPPEEEDIVTVLHAVAEGPVSAATGESITFDGRGSYIETPMDADPSMAPRIIMHAWDLDASDGVDFDVTGPMIEHIYERPGTYVATLRVIDSTGRQADDTVTCTITAPPAPRPTRGMCGAIQLGQFVSWMTILTLMRRRSRRRGKTPSLSFCTRPPRG